MSLLESLTKDNSAFDCVMDDMRMSADSILNMTTRTTDFCKICQGTSLKPEFSEFPIVQTLHNAIKESNILHTSKVPLVMYTYLDDQLCPDMEFSVMSDKSWIRDAVLFLLSNAKKYSSLDARSKGQSQCLSEVVLTEAECSEALNGKCECSDSETGGAGADSNTLAVESSNRLGNHKGLGTPVPVQVVVRAYSSMKSVSISVLDNGVGMERENHRQLFRLVLSQLY